MASFDEIPAEVQEEIKAELLKWMVSGKIPLPIQANQPMLRTWKWLPMSTSQVTGVVSEEEVKRVETPGVKSIDEVAAFLECSRRSDDQDFGLHCR